MSLQDVSNNQTFYKHMIYTISKPQYIGQLASYNSIQAKPKLNQIKPTPN